MSPPLSHPDSPPHLAESETACPVASAGLPWAPARGQRGQGGASREATEEGNHVVPLSLPPPGAGTVPLSSPPPRPPPPLSRAARHCSRAARRPACAAPVGCPSLHRKAGIKRAKRGLGRSPHFLHGTAGRGLVARRAPLRHPRTQNCHHTAQEERRRGGAIRRAARATRREKERGRAGASKPLVASVEPW